jgi:hypothetical protein
MDGKAACVTPVECFQQAGRNFIVPYVPTVIHDII